MENGLIYRPVGLGCLLVRFGLGGAASQADKSVTKYGQVCRGEARSHWPGKGQQLLQGLVTSLTPFPASSSLWPGGISGKQSRETATVHGDRY